MTRTGLFNLTTTNEAHLNFKNPSPMVDPASLERAITGPMTASRMTPVSALPQSAMKSARIPLLTN